MNFSAILIAFAAIVSTVSAYKILLLVPFPAPSHWLWFEHFLNGMLNRGHEVTAITNTKVKQKHLNYTEIIIDPAYDIPYYFPVKETFKLKYGNDLDNLFLFWDVGLLTTEHAFHDKGVQKMIARDDQQFDLVISEQFFQDSWLMFGHKYNCPIVTIGTLGIADYMDRNMGILTPWSFVPHINLPYTDRMSFWERCYNVLLSIVDFVLRRFYYLPKQQAMVDEFFAPLAKKGPLPTVAELEKRISLILTNSHMSMSPPRPSMPGIIHVGGAHVKAAEPLPNDIQQFLDNAKHGVIYFSLGSYLKSSEMPPEKLKVFLDTFRSLKQQVLWKYEDENLKNLPKNVMVKKWMPQTDILAHDNVILFIGHGGIFGTQESLYRGVPILFIPFYGDQYRNSLKCEAQGYGIKVDFKELTADILTAKLSEMINNSKYLLRAKEASSLFRDNIVPPMDAAMFWIEYVVRNKGAPHLKSSAVDLSWHEYLLLDVLGFFAIVIILVVLSLYKFVSLLIGLISKKNSSQHDSNKKRK